MAKYLIFKKEKEAIDFNNKMIAKLQNKWTDGITNNYCNIEKHPDKDEWSVVVDEKYKTDFDSQDRVKEKEKTEDWKPKKTFN